MFGSFGVSLTIALYAATAPADAVCASPTSFWIVRRALRVEDDADPVVDERLARRRHERAREALAGALVGGAELGELGLLLLRRHLGEIEAGERRAGRRCPSASARRRASGRRSPCRSARRPAARSRDRVHACTFFGSFSVFFSELEIDGTPLEAPPPRRMSPTPVPPAPTPKRTKPPPRATARKTNIHLAWRRSRGKNIVSSIDGAVERLALRVAATAASCFGRFVLLLSNRAIGTFLSGSAVRRPPE